MQLDLYTEKYSFDLLSMKIEFLELLSLAYIWYLVDFEVEVLSSRIFWEVVSNCVENLFFGEVPVFNLEMKNALQFVIWEKLNFMKYFWEVCRVQGP